jgi:hypothetical protein
MHAMAISLTPPPPIPHTSSPIFLLFVSHGWNDAFLLSLRMEISICLDVLFCMPNRTKCILLVSVMLFFVPYGWKSPSEWMWS